MPKPKQPHTGGHTQAPDVYAVDDYGFRVPAGTTPEQLAHINLIRKQNAEFALWLKAKGIPAWEDGHLAEFMAARPDLYPKTGNLLGA